MGVLLATIAVNQERNPEMSERNKPHNGRDRSGHFKVKQADVEELRADPQGEEYVKDDVRLGGAIEDVGLEGAERARRIEKLIEENRENVERATDGE